MTTAAAFEDLPDLALEDTGGVTLAASDDFFAEKENLLRARPAEWREHAYTERGKWMDGWESRRRRDARDPGGTVSGDDFDWCLIRLGLPGRIHGVVVDTAFFRGNYPAHCAILACELDDALDLDALETATWTTLLPRVALQGNDKNRFAIAPELAARRFTHLRLDIFPDGGVARLRVHGEVAPDWRRLGAFGGVVDLAALENGAVVESCSDMFFGSRNNLIKPGPSRSMADGWETRRRRGPGHDWALVRLAAAGVVERVEVDTSHFKGNAPGTCRLEGVHAPGAAAAALETSPRWRTILQTPLQPHTRHRFEDELRRVGVCTHVRLSVFPDGGVARLRVWGGLAGERGAGLERLDALSVAEATSAFSRCCGAPRWAAAMAEARPFEDRAALLRLGERLWWSLGEDDWLLAFASHPRIGDKPPGAGAWSAAEQHQVSDAEAATRAELAAGNQSYFERFGFIFIVCATGRSAADLLADLRRRLAAERADELRTAAEEQAKITRLRLDKLLAELA